MLDAQINKEYILVLTPDRYWILVVQRIDRPTRVETRKVAPIVKPQDRVIRCALKREQRPLDRVHELYEVQDFDVIAGAVPVSKGLS